MCISERYVVLMPMIFEEMPKKKLKVDFMACYTYLFPFYLSVEHSAGFLIDSTSSGDIELKGSRDKIFRMNNIGNTDIFVLSINYS